ncbi:ABC transporter substrate-binding protein [Nocardioides albus]|uniref:Branched-chain amino acid transport system substrate-binding protein n=1 Tax=Nocardioides albus TaxID=1841 RepID=A0A7W5F9J1_9ACTN|nr:ABC transporter substrate-binding protein [Nocardioides albus]MBB3090101.1 branched-chain amino acid transport system substrate-binding protein [Nocardioides albus]GGU27713.1 branched-chain amino acid ABC transporter substrate-binding protein [Nocardioides albus]
MTAATGVFALAAAMVGCGSADGAGGDDDAYHVVVLGGLSSEGILADNASTSVNAAQAGVDFANDNGGVVGRKVTIDVIDDTGDPTVAVSKLREAIAENKPDLVLNSGPSTVAEATLPILNQNQILSFNIGPTVNSSDPKKFPLNFDIAAGADQQIAAYQDHFEEKGYGKIAILHGNSAYGETFGSTAEDLLTKSGVEVTVREEYDVAALDMTSQLQKLEASEPDAVIVDAYGAPLGYILKGVGKLGWDVPLIGNTSVSSTSLTGAAAPEGIVGTPEAKSLVMQVPSAAKRDPAAKAVNEAVERMLKHGEIKSSMVLAMNYDALPLVMAAAESADSIEAADLAKALENPKVLERASTALYDDYGFSSDVHKPQDVSREYQFIAPSVLKDGQFQ